MEKTKITMNVPYFQVPNDIFDLDLGLKDYEKLVYIYLCRCGNQGGRAFPSYNTIAEKCSISRSSALRTVKKLIKLGLINKTIRPKEKKNNDTNIYEVCLPSVCETPPPSVCETPPSVCETPNKELLYKEPDNYKEPIIYSKIYFRENDFLDIYLKEHEKAMGREHVMVTEQKKEYILNFIKTKVENVIDIESWEKVVKEHFKYLPESNNGNILSLITSIRRYFVDVTNF